MDFTTNEAASLLGMQPRSITRYIERGIIAATKHGRDYLINEEEIERFKRERRGQGRPKNKDK